MWYEASNPYDQVATSRCQRSPAFGEGSPGAVLGGAQPQRLHAAPIVRGPGPQDVLQDRLSRHRPAPHRFRRAARGDWADQGSPLLHPLLRGRPAAKKGEVVCLLVCATTSATDRGLIGDSPTVAV